MLWLDVKMRSMHDDEWFLKWVGLPNIWVKTGRFNGIKFLILSLVSKEYHFEHFPLKSPVIIEIAGLRLLMSLIGMSRESQKNWECSRFRLGDLYKDLSKHRLFFTVISVTKHSFRLDISLRIMGNWSLSYKHPAPLMVLLGWSSLTIE